MTDQELIKALRWCGDCLHDCMGCPGEENCNAFDRGGKTVVDAADRMEALLRDNAALDREVQIQICKRSELEREIGRLEIQVEYLKAGSQTTVELDPDTGSFSIGFQQPRPKWVSVKEQMPRYNRDVLCYRPEMAMKIVVSSYDGYYGEDDNEWYEEWSNFGYDINRKCVITHWMPLPEPPSTEVSPTGQKG